MQILDFEAARCRRDMGPGATVEDGLDGCIACLQSEIGECGNGSRASLKRLKRLAQSLVARVDARLALPD